MDIKLLKTLKPATKEWAEKILDEYELQGHHVKLLILAGQSWDTAQESRNAIEKHGTIYTDRFDCPHARPEVNIERDARLAFARLIRELNLDVDMPEDSRPPRLKY